MISLSLLGSAYIKLETLWNCVETQNVIGKSFLTVYLSIWNLNGENIFQDSPDARDLSRDDD